MDIKLLSVKDLSVRWQKDEGTTGTEAYIYIYLNFTWMILNKTRLDNYYKK